MTEEKTQIKIRLDASNHTWLKRQAKTNHRSITAEVNFLVSQVRRKRLINNAL
ncbi:hypothetical protein [Veronia pacifica]|uniref:hypothetical protein n=1 Tax=Veronia pacifica TaxID=1080227 RepID=UPI001585E430|nr:hypothetical protein [Veronia pacifica]